MVLRAGNYFRLGSSRNLSASWNLSSLPVAADVMHSIEELMSCSFHIKGVHEIVLCDFNVRGISLHLTMFTFSLSRANGNQHSLKIA